MEMKNAEIRAGQAFRRTTLLLLIFVVVAFGQYTARHEINIPDIKGYETLKCDFHMHTVFSDGSVWPTVRVDEAWRQGLDVISITDHIEYQPKKKDIPTNHNRNYEIAKSRADDLGIMLIHGAEITRPDPPGHMNAIFLSDVDPLDTPDNEEAVRRAVEQGGFIFWNHPGWKQPGRQSVWYDEQEEFFQRGHLSGIEVVNGRRYDPIAHQWCIDKNLTMMANSDIHNPINLDYDISNGERRPMTFVYAKNKSIKSLKDGLQKRRTVLYFKNELIGKAKLLGPIFKNSIEIKNPKITLEDKDRGNVQIYNSTELDYELEANGEIEGLSFAENVTLHAGKTALISIQQKNGTLRGKKKIKLPFKVKNMRIVPDDFLSVEIPVEIKFE
jgi:3',5'-nucleoside bisphosphate phosphatase